METFRYFAGLRTALLALPLIWLAHASGALDAFDELLYDTAVALLAEQQRDAAVLLVEAAPGEPPDWSRLRANLGAAGVMLVLAIDPAHPEAVVEAAGGPGVRLALALPAENQPELPGASRLARRPATLPDDFPLGALTRPPGATGIAREQLAGIELGSGRRLPGVEALAAGLAGRPAPEARFMVNFHHGLTLPATSSAAVERQPPIAALASGKVALVGSAPGPGELAVRVPGAGRPRVSPLAFHGLALDTLLQQREVRAPGPLQAALLMALLAATVLLALQPLRPSGALWAAGLAALLVLLACGATLRWLDRWIAPLPLLLLLAVIVLGVLRDKSRAANHHLAGLMQLATAKLQTRVLPAGFEESSEHWAYVINLVDQTLLLNRSIFLERTPDDHRVREIQALRCSISDISELRRDFERSPYTTAMAQRGTIEIRPDRPFLSPHEGERQFLTPLVFAGEVQGFWAFGVLADKIADDPQFRATSDRLAEQIALLLYQRGIWQRRTRAERTWQRYLADGGAGAMAELGRAVSALERRLEGFEEVFATLRTAAAYYDLFGRVVLINPEMSRLLGERRISPYEMTAVGLICALTARPADEIREAVRKLVFDEQALSLEVVEAGGGSGRHLLHVRPLRPAEDEREQGFSEHGILLEIVDVAAVRQSMEFRAEALEQVFSEILVRLRAGAQPDQAARLLERARALVSQPLEGEGALALYPLRLQSLLERCAEQAAPALHERDLRLVLDPHPDAGLAYAEPDALRRVLTRIIELLAGDALSGSELVFEIVPQHDQLLLDCSNSGFGIPDERLQALLSPLAERPEPLWRELRAAPRLLARWGGECEMSSRVGQGFRVRLRLRRFH